MAGTLLDSDVIIWCLRGRPDVVAWVQALARERRPACSAISIVEVELGMKAKEEAPTRALLAALEVVPVDYQIASRAASYMRSHRRKGVTLDFADALIAATCAAAGLRLATFNRRHYPMKELVFATVA